MANKPPACLFYWKDWLIDTRELGPYGRGVYIDMLALCWENGSIADDPATVGYAVGAQISDLPLAAVEPRLQPGHTPWLPLRQKFSAKPVEVAAAVAAAVVKPLPRGASEEQRFLWDGELEMVEQDVVARLRACGTGRLFHIRLEIEREKQARYRSSQGNKGVASAIKRRTRGATAVEATAQPTGQPGPQPRGNLASAFAEVDPEDTHTAGVRRAVVTPLSPLPPVPPRGEFAALVARADRGGLLPDRDLVDALAELSRDTARAQGTDPVRMAHDACEAFEFYRASCAPAMRPDWSGSALRRHWGRLTRIIAGTDPPPEPWSLGRAATGAGSRRPVTVGPAPSVDTAGMAACEER